MDPYSFSCVPTAPPHKQSARARNSRHRAKPLYPQTDSQNHRHHINAPVAMFRSPRVLEEIAQVEKQHQHRMTPEEALQNLQGMIATFSNVKDAHEILNGLKRACWQPFVVELDSGNPTHQPQVLYSQLFRGTKSMVHEGDIACQNLRDQIRQLKERNNQLPKRIQESQGALTRAVASPVHSIVSSEQKLFSSDAKAPYLHLERKETRQREELRTWARNNAFGHLNDLHVRHNELKQNIYDTSCKLKKTEQANCGRLKRLDDLRTLAATTTSQLSPCRVDSIASTQQHLARVITASSTNRVLRGTLNERKACVRARTEAIFDVRANVHDLNNQRVTVENELKDLKEQAAHVKRACTPRPDWSNLRDDTSITTAEDRVERCKGATHDERWACEQRVMEIVSSNWSTVAKVDALAAALATIRSRDTAIDTISCEETKLTLLHNEITRVLQQLEDVKRQVATETSNSCIKWQNSA